MKYMRKLCVLMALALLITAVAGCGLVKVDPEKDRQQVIAEVNGEQILKGELLDIYAQYGITEEQEKDASLKDQIKNLKLSILEQLIIQELLEQKAKEAGYTMSDEYRKEAQAIIDDFLKGQEELLKLQDEEEDPNRDYAKEAREDLLEQLEAMGVTEEEFIEKAAKDIMIDAFLKEITKEVEASEEEIQKYYNETLSAQKEDPASISPYDIVLYRPERARVKHILIRLPDDQIKEYQSLVSQGKEDEAKEYLDEKLEAIKPKAMEVLEKAKAGEDFDALIEEYGEDPGMVDNEEGYEVFEDSGMIEEFEQASLSLKDGEISDLVGGMYGYHIIKRYETLAEETVTLDEVRDEIKEMLDTEKKNQEISAKIEAWQKEANIKRYEKRI